MRPPYLEEHIHHEHLVTLAAEGVKTIGHSRPHTDQDSDHHETLAESAKNRVRSMGHCVTKEEHPKPAKDSTGQHEDKTEFRLTLIQVSEWLCPSRCSTY